MIKIMTKKKIEKLKENTINNIINVFNIHLADAYLTKLQKEKKNPPEIIANYLDRSIYLTKEKINIKNQEKNIIKIKDENWLENFHRALDDNKDYENLCYELNTIFHLISEKELQDKLYDDYYQHFIKFKESHMELEKQKKEFASSKLFNNITKFFNKNNYLINKI